MSRFKIWVPNFPVSPAAPPPVSPATPIVQATTPQPTHQLPQPLPSTPGGEVEQSTNLMSTKPQLTQAGTTQNLTVNQPTALDEPSGQKTVADDEKAKAEADLARLKTQGVCGRYHENNINPYDDYMSVLPKDASFQRDISGEAVWSLSSCKVEGFGINQLLDERTDTFWQSDGVQPHMITIEFQKYTEISFLLMYLDFKSDESYTPQKIQVYTGNSILDLEEPPKVVNLNEPNGWQNHQNGRDTHVRGLKVLGPRSQDGNVVLDAQGLLHAFKQNDLILEYTLR
ncbi:Anaphase-promoting complex subunit 10 [Aphelenchoides besseyi]|nr:Anaphase-promoting complex subunit 10 [Aphelenchoides besseyi]